MASWQFRTLNPNDTSGTSTSEDNFAQEERTSADILVRECIQNPLDARYGQQNVEVHFRWVTADRKSTQFTRDVLTPDLAAQLARGGVLQSASFANEVSFLVIEDFGTTGLCGTYQDSGIEGDGENWNAFWFREGEGAKPTRANGGAGQGKLTMYVASGLRTVIALTTRVTDDKRLLFGSCRFRRNYLVGSARYAREARFGTTSDPDVLSQPIADEGKLDQYESDLGIARGKRPGTSFVIPMPDQAITPEAISIAVLNEFYFPILRGRLTVFVNGAEFSKSTITSLAQKMHASLRGSAEMRIFIDQVCAQHLAGNDVALFNENWGQDAKLLPEHLAEAQATKIKLDFSEGKIVSARFPIRVSSVKKGAELGYVRVFAQGGDSVIETDEIFVRQDLAIDKEKSLRSSKRLTPARALILVDDEVLSQYLAAAEEPTHREWNGSRPKLLEQYRNVAKPLRLVRHAASRLVEFLSPPAAKDSVALSSFFPDADAEIGANKGKAAKNDKADVGPNTVKTELPPPRRRKLELLPLDDGATVRVTEGQTTEGDFPIRCQVELAYATEFGNAYEQWDAADFFLSKTDVLETMNVSDLDFKGNKLAFAITSPDALLTVGGFDKRRQLEIRLTYEENANAGD